VGEAKVDHIPTPKVNRNSILEQAARMKDLSDRAKKARAGDSTSHMLDRPGRGRDIL
jgi:hypothetical protein